MEPPLAVFGPLLKVQMKNAGVFRFSVELRVRESLGGLVGQGFPEFVIFVDDSCVA